jgi:hypothetical protein
MAWGDAANRPYNLTIDNNKFLDTHEDGALNTSGTGHQITNNYFSCQNGFDANRVGSSNSRYANNRFDNWSKPATSTAHTDLFQAFTTNGGEELHRHTDRELGRPKAPGQHWLLDLAEQYLLQRDWHDEHVGSRYVLLQ